MDNFEGGLADILRAGGSGAITTTTTTTTTPTTTTTNTTLDGDTPAEITDWQFQYSDPPNYPLDDFRDPFPLLHELNMPVSSSMMIGTGGFGSGVFSQISCHNIFSGDSPAMVASPRPSLKPPPTLVSNEHMMSNISVNSSKSLLVDSSTNGVQISSPRNTGIKRRKSQAKKVVCIPAPTPANSRATGEVVPSDLWAWRKYGQKPIKGSPYPRGYYRCSSSKGCSARKQVERSRTDPNMLVITYTSEHNHPWPVQRNVLAGSTRSQPTKNNPSKGQKEMIPNKEQNEITAPDKAQVSNLAMTRNSTTGPSMKEEMEESDKLSERFVQSYKPVLPEYNSKNNEDLFANLEEIEGESEFSLLFTQGFSGEDIENKEGLDPFSFYDWIGDNSNNTSFGEAKGSSQ